MEIPLALTGVIAGFLVTRAVDRSAARRSAYAKFLGAAEMQAFDLVRRMNGIRAEAHPLQPLRDPDPLNEPMGEIIIVGSERMIGLVNEMVDGLNKMREIVTSPAHGRARGQEWDNVTESYGRLRKRFFRQGRIESARWPLSDRFFESTVVAADGSNADERTRPGAAD